MQIIPKIHDILKKSFPQYKVNIDKKTKDPSDHIWVIKIDDSQVTQINIEQMEYDFKFFAESGHQVEKLISKFIEDKILEWEKKNKKKVDQNINISYDRLVYAIDNSASATAAARYLGIGRTKFKRLAQEAGLWDKIVDRSKQRWSKEKLINPDSGDEPIRSRFGAVTGLFDLVVEGKHPQQNITANRPYSSWKLKDRLVIHGLKQECCDICGFHDSRLTDGRVPLLVDYTDGNPWNTRLSNIRFLCLNCYFLYVGTPWYIKSYGNLMWLKWQKTKENQGKTDTEFRAQHPKDQS